MKHEPNPKTAASAAAAPTHRIIAQARLLIHSDYRWTREEFHNIAGVRFPGTPSVHRFRLDTLQAEFYGSSVCSPELSRSLMPVQMELAKIIISEMQDEQIIVLKEVDGDRKFPIVIGTSEAFAIDRRLKGFIHPRPLTHDLLASIIEQMGGTIER